MRAIRPPLAAPLAGVTLAVIGCGTTEIDHVKAENLVRTSVAKLGRTHVTSVSCPSGVKAKKGGTFTCYAALANGTSGTVTIHMTDDNGKVEINGPSDYHAGQ